MAENWETGVLSFNVRLTVELVPEMEMLFRTCRNGFESYCHVSDACNWIFTAGGGAANVWAYSEPDTGKLAKRAKHAVIACFLYFV